ncbi:hypothetical protein B0A55_07278 [Friedmanniomyces simplex]|uniref:Uncharacterized protein n=1 Tax=Friedmanniomyces simplex TaxID=329884 RepID=A0A4U0X4A4_9PEZI|nr:hypothetical protein B0A55_07278 [Friedmanniomyces simplex]
MQSEQFAQRIRAGGLDDQVQQTLGQNSMGQAPAGQSMTTSFQTPFGEFQIPQFMPPMQPFPPMPFGGMPTMSMPGMPFPAMQPMQIPAMTPMFSPPPPAIHSPFALTQHTPAMPQPFTMDLAPMQGFPQPFSQTVNFPGGQANRQAVNFPGGSASHQNVNFSGRNGNAQFSYSSSSTSGNWSSQHNAPAGYPALPPATGYSYAALPPATGYPTPAQNQSVPPTPMPQQAPMPMDPYQGFAEDELTPPEAPEAPAQGQAQNSRLHDAFTQQLNEETYFSNPPGAPDRST